MAIGIDKQKNCEDVNKEYEKSETKVWNANPQTGILNAYCYGTIPGTRNI